MEISIIVPIKDNSDPHIKDCINALKTQTFSGDYEIIVIQGGNIAQARNLGIKIGSGELIAFIDSDCVAKSDWLDNMENALLRFNNAGGVGGPNISPPQSDDLSKSIDAVFSTYIGSLGSTSLHIPSTIKKVKSIACINSLYWKKSIDEARGFDERFEYNEDTNLSYRVRAQGYDLFFTPEGIVFHHRKNTFLKFIMQFYTYGISRMRSIFTDRRYFDLQIMFLFFLFLLFPLIAFSLPFIASYILILYFLTIFLISIFKTFQKRKIIFLVYMPILFTMEHLSYGIGLLVGSIKGKWEKPRGHPELFFHEKFIQS